MILFEQIEKELVAEGKTPVSLSPEREELEKGLVEGTSSAICTHEDWHGDIPHQDMWNIPVGRPE